MEKIKIFSFGTHTDFEEMETEINKWLSINQKIVVVDRKIAMVEGINLAGGRFINCTIAIFYR